MTNLHVDSSKFDLLSHSLESFQAVSYVVEDFVFLRLKILLKKYCSCLMGISFKIIHDYTLVLFLHVQQYDEFDRFLFTRLFEKNNITHLK